MRRGDAGDVRSTGAPEVLYSTCTDSSIDQAVFGLSYVTCSCWPHLPVIASTGWTIHEDFGILEIGSLGYDWPLL
jgi:hypothetical protein